MSNAQQALFDKYGGVPVITGLVGTFYARVMDSERLAPYFAGIDMPRLIAHQVAFFARRWVNLRKSSPISEWQMPISRFASQRLTLMRL